MDWRACKGRGNVESSFLGDWAFTGEEQHGHHQAPGCEKQSGELARKAQSPSKVESLIKCVIVGFKIEL